MNILDRIIAHKRGEIESPGYFSAIEQVLETVPHTRDGQCDCGTVDAPFSAPDWIAALRSVPIGLIAEVKRRSPSAGAIREPFDAAAIARAYEVAGAQAISCLMDSEFFGGGEDQWRAVRGASRLPMLYKEFVIDPRQIFHAEALGASAVLLIAAVLEDARLGEFIRLTEASGMTPLVEVHTHDEVERALAAGATCVGINNRNLKTFETSIETSLTLCQEVPDGIFLVSESGIQTADDVQRLRDAGFSAVLVGEHLLRCPDLGQAVRRLLRGEGPPSPRAGTGARSL